MAANARHFTAASSEKVTLSLGSTAALTAATIAGVVRRTTTGVFSSIVAAGNNPNGWELGFRDTNTLMLWNGSAEVHTTSTFTSAVWYFVCATKASGTTTPRFHWFDYSTSTWTHENASGTLANGSAPATNVWLGASNNGTGDFMNGDIQAAAYWNSELTDAQVETLAQTFDSWRDLSPTDYWAVNQGTVTEAVFDEVGTANQTAITGTTLSTGAPGFQMVDPPMFINVGTAVVSANSVANPTTFSPGIPASMATGDVMLCVTTSRSNSATVATPSGWTVFPGFPVQSGTASGGTIYVFYRRWVSGDAAPSVSWSGVATGTSGDSCMAQIAGYRYVDWDVTDATVVKGTDAAITTTATIGSVTTGQRRSKVLGITMRVDDNAHTWTPTTNWTERFDTHTTTGTGHSRHLQERVFPAAASTGSVTIAPSLTTSVRGLSATLALKARRRRGAIFTRADRTGAFNLSPAAFR